MIDYPPNPQTSVAMAWTGAEGLLEPDQPALAVAANREKEGKKKPLMVSSCEPKSLGQYLRQSIR